MKIRRVKPKPVHVDLDEIRELIDDVDECNDQIENLKQACRIDEKRERLKTLLRASVPIDANKEHFVLVDDRLAARVFYRTGRTNINVPLLESLVPVSIFEQVATKSQTQVVLEIADPVEFEKRRKKYKVDAS